MSQPPFERVALIGIGLIGSSLAHAIRRGTIAGHLAVCDSNPEHRKRASELGLADSVSADPAEAVKNADLIVLCTPLGTYGDIAQTMGPAVKPGAIVTDVGSVKMSVLRDVGPHLGDGVHLIPAHPVAGTEHSGPDAGFATLFDGRWCIITPPAGANPQAVERLSAFWRGVGSNIEIMDAGHHDKVLAMTSHLPHLIAYTIVGTATDLEEHIRGEVIKFSAGGFRDFTRIAASDPTMWRDVFLANREAVLEMLQRFSEDLTALQRAIRWGEGEVLFDLFTRTRAARRGVIDAKQA